MQSEIWKSDTPSLIKEGDENKYRVEIYPSNFDVCYTTQKAQSYNRLLRLILHIYIFI